MERCGTRRGCAAEGLVLAMVRTNEEFRREPQYTDVPLKNALITVEKIGERSVRSRRAIIFLSLVSGDWEWVT